LWANGEEVEQMDEQKRRERLERERLLPDGAYGAGDVVRRDGRWYVESSVGSRGPFESYGDARDWIENELGEEEQ
jgi:hypothetical protein